VEEPSTTYRRGTDEFELPEEVCESYGTLRKGRVGPHAERVVVTRRAELPGFETWTAWNSRRLWNVFHTTYTFCVPVAVEDNTAPRWKYRQREYDMDLASLRLLEPGETHVALCNPGTDFDVLMVDDQLLLDPEAPRPVHFGTGQVEDPALAKELIQLCSRVRRAEDLLEVESTWCGIRSRLLDRAGERVTPAPSLCPRGVRRAREYLHANFSARVSLAQLAEVSGLSKFHLASSFRRCFGVPIHRYLINLRCGHATDLLRHGNKVSDVAIRTGFCNASHLNRVFVDLLGVTPGRYRSLGRRGAISG
jgi:AraC-like DNA-binding protein